MTIKEYRRVPFVVRDDTPQPARARSLHAYCPQTSMVSNNVAPRTVNRGIAPTPRSAKGGTSCASSSSPPPCPTSRTEKARPHEGSCARKARIPNRAPSRRTRR